MSERLAHHAHPRQTVATGARRLVGLAVAVSLLSAAAPARAQSVESIVQWHRVLLTALGVPGALPPTVFPTRPIAMVSVAIFDAANSFDRVYQPYATRAEPAVGASPDAAVSRAAHDVLAALFPSQRVVFQAALATSLAGIAPQAARDGERVGAEVAQAILALRANDGWSRPAPAYELPSLPGYWTPTPPASLPAAFTHYPEVQGFIIASRDRFLPAGPPPLTSARYATDFNETKAIGAVNSATRTAEQTQTARLFAGVGTTTNAFAVWNGLLGNLAPSRGLSGLDAARAFALMNMAAHDGFLTTFTGKFLYGLWRPVTAIRQADRDGNAATEADPEWTPLLTTPPYPGHPGNMACHGATQAQVLARIFGRDGVPFQVTWTLADGSGITRPYNGFRQLADEAAQSRIYGGIHFAFEGLASIGVCNQLADYAVDNYLRVQ